VHAGRHAVSDSLAPCRVWPLQSPYAGVVRALPALRLLCTHTASQMRAHRTKAATALKGIVTVAAVDCDAHKDVGGEGFGVEGWKQEGCLNLAPSEPSVAA